MSCPDYYLLASGREFIDFANNELSAWLKPRVKHEIYHCIISAMEHRFRCGNKEGEAETDKAAEAFWLSKAEQINDEDYERGYDMSDVVPVVLEMVDVERVLKDDKLAQRKIIEHYMEGKHND
jgi:hypothetical protein